MLKKNQQQICLCPPDNTCRHDLQLLGVVIVMYIESWIYKISVFNGGWALKWTTQLWDEVGSVVMGDTDGEVVLTGLGSVTFTDGITFLKHSRVFTFNRVRYVT